MKMAGLTREAYEEGNCQRPYGVGALVALEEESFIVAGYRPLVSQHLKHS